MDDEELGREATLIPQSRTPTSAPDDKDYVGNEQTLVGAPVPAGLAGAARGSDDPGRADLGRDATLIGDAPAGIASGTPRPKGDSTASGKKTSPTLDDGWHLKGRQGPLTGKSIGDYEIGGILGEGGMGTVYRARQISLKRRVALKVLPPNLAHDLRLRERFEQEARTASLLNSPHVVQVFAAGAMDDMVYFVMEFVEGTDLSEMTRARTDAKQPFTTDECANFIVQAARGLAEAGKHGIVHRDIKPANLMITTKGVVKIADFGISKVAGEHQLTMTGTAVGTPAYCSPEQGRGDPVDVRADIYSLGVVFYELLTGVKPFEGATANALIYQHNYAEPRLPRELNEAIPESYQAVVLKCLQKDPAKRYQDAAELVADLEQVRVGSAPMTALMSAFGTGAEEAMRRLGIRQRRIWPYIAAGLLVAAGLAFTVVHFTGQAQHEHDIQAEVGRLRTQLAVLDKAQPVPKGTDDQLKHLTDLVSSQDTDLQRWSTKLARVLALQKSLSLLDPARLPDRAQRDRASADLLRYQDDVGSSGEDVKRAHAVLDAAAAAAASARGQLADIDKAAVVTTALAERLSPQLASLDRLAGKDDADCARWHARLAREKAHAAELRRELSALDDPQQVITEARMAALGDDLAALTAIVGADDKGVRSWGGRLEDDRSELARLRKNLKRLDAVEMATAALMAALGSDLASYKTLVDPNDPDLRSWTRKVADSNARIASLRKGLARLDKPEPLTVDEQAGYQDQLTAYRSLVSPDDGQLVAWTARLRAEAENLATMRDEIGRLDRPDLSVVELDASEKALQTLIKIGGIAEDQRVIASRRLEAQRRRIDELRRQIHLRQETQTVDQPLAEAVAALTRIDGDQDPDVVKWGPKVALYNKLRASLLVLDQQAPPPERADALLKDYRAVAGEDAPEVKRWAAKLGRIAALRTALSPLDQVAPLPERAAADAHALVSEVSDKDPDAARWSAKVAKVGGLIASLSSELANAYILPPAAAKQRTELVKLVGGGDQVVDNLVTRVAVLIGPGRPAWASDYRRDEFGPYADLTVGGVTQRLRYVPAGTFVMGSPESEAGRDRDETQVRVTLTHSYWLADSPCTQAFWEAVAGKDDSRFTGLERPVERISWDDSSAFCIELSRKVNGVRARLPTEAEYEYACRAGDPGPYPSTLGGLSADKLDDIAWFSGDTSSTHGVKARQCNRLGIFDMIGNVWEWCQDRYGSYSPIPVTDPLGKETEKRVARGGSWGDDASRCRAANRAALRQDMRTLYVGFRFAVAVDWPAGQEPIVSQPGIADEPIQAARPPTAPLASVAPAAPSAPPSHAAATVAH